MIPDYSKTYFPPPPGASTTGTGQQSSIPNVDYPPPPPRASPFAHARQTSTHSPSQSSTQHNVYFQPQGPTLSPPVPSPHISHASSSSSPYLPHADVLQSLQPPTLNQEVPQYTPSQAPRSPRFFTQFASFTLQNSDRIQFLRFPTALYPLLRATILSAWPQGIQAEYLPSTQCLEIKLKGYPWGQVITDIQMVRNALVGDFDTHAVYARRLVCALLAMLHGEGWVLMVCTDAVHVQWDTDTLVFRHQIPAPARCEWFSMHFTARNKLRLIDAPSDLCMSIVGRLIKDKQELKHKASKMEGCYEVKFTTMGQSMMSNENMKTRKMFLDMLGCLEQSGWTVYTSIGHNTKSDGSRMLDTLYCCKPVGWLEGAPVYHN